MQRFPCYCTRSRSPRVPVVDILDDEHIEFSSSPKNYKNLMKAIVTELEKSQDTKFRNSIDVWSSHRTQIASSRGQHGAHLGPVGTRWAPCWPHQPCYQGSYCYCWLSPTVLALLVLILGCFGTTTWTHYSDVIMGAMASQIACVFSVCPGADKRKHQSSASLAFVRGIHRWPARHGTTTAQSWHVQTFYNVMMPSNGVSRQFQISIGVELRQKIFRKMGPKTVLSL